MVRGRLGQPLIVHNCVQGECATLLREALVACDAAGLSSVLQVHDEIVVEAPESRIETDLATLCEIMERTPDWAEGLPLEAEGAYGVRYKVPHEI